MRDVIKYRYLELSQNAMRVVCGLSVILLFQSFQRDDSVVLLSSLSKSDKQYG